MASSKPEIYMSSDEIKSWPTYKSFPSLGDFYAPLRRRMQEVGEYSRNQAAGRRWAIGCVSLEITQRCNLDCTLCYLSDSSEAVKDIPLQEIFRRIDNIYRHYGPGTDIQVSGGDPTLRKREELVQIVRRIASYNMESTLFTNGILATRDLLAELKEAGMFDVAFHVDLTQERKGFETEEQLNEIRLKYIERAKGLGLNIFFNTTVFAGNFKEIPSLVEFFKNHAKDVDLCSFQLQADQGRGVLRERDFIISQETVVQQIEKGAGTKINFDVPLIGHPKCNKKAVMFEANGTLYNMADNKGFIAEMIRHAPRVKRDQHARTVLSNFAAVAKRPYLWKRTGVYLKDLAVEMGRDVVASRGKVNNLTFFIHNFMDACRLEKDRIQGCVFMTATSEGPISMCMHNAKRDDYILKPFRVATSKGEKLFQPLTGDMDDLDQVNNKRVRINPLELPMKNMKGRVKQAAMRKRKKNTSKRAKRKKTGKKVTKEVLI